MSVHDWAAATSTDNWFRNQKMHLVNIIGDAIRERGENPWIERTGNDSILIGVATEEGVAFYFTCKITAHSRRRMEIEAEPC